MSKQISNPSKCDHDWELCHDNNGGGDYAMCTYPECQAMRSITSEEFSDLRAQQENDDIDTARAET